MMRHLPALGATSSIVLALAVPPLLASESFTVEEGQTLIDSGHYERAVRLFTRIIDEQPLDADGYRGRAEALLLLGRYSDALRDYARIMARVLPVDPDAIDVIRADYSERLALNPHDVPALTGASFVCWWSFDYQSALRLLDELLELRPNDLYARLFRGSNLLLSGTRADRGVTDVDWALASASRNPHVHFIAADAFTYGLPDPERALAEATLALDGGLDTPRVQAILADAYLTLGHTATAAEHFLRHFELITEELVPTAPLLVEGTLTLDLVPGHTFEIPVPATAGQAILIDTSSPTHEIYDSILVLLAPDGTPLAGADDVNKYFAALDWVAPATGTYRLRVTSFEGVSTGELLVTRARPTRNH